MRKVNMIASIVMIVMSVILYLATLNLPSRAAILPKLTASLLGILGIMLLIQYFLTKNKEDGANPFKGIPWVKWFFTLGAWMISILLMLKVGFFPAFLIFIIVITWVLEGMEMTIRGIGKPVVFGFTFMIIVYFIFEKLFQLRLP